MVNGVGQLGICWLCQTGNGLTRSLAGLYGGVGFSANDVRIEYDTCAFPFFPELFSGFGGWSAPSPRYQDQVMALSPVIVVSLNDVGYDSHLWLGGNPQVRRQDRFSEIPAPAGPTSWLGSSERKSGGLEHWLDNPDAAVAGSQ